MTVIPQGLYQLAVKNGNMIYTSGITPRKDGELILKGKITNGFDEEQCKRGAEQIIKNLRWVLDDEMPKGKNIDKIVEMTVFVATGPEFYEISSIADYIVEAATKYFGATVVGSRSAIGVYALPGNASLEAKFIIAIK